MVQTTGEPTARLSGISVLPRSHAATADPSDVRDAGSIRQYCNETLLNFDEIPEPVRATWRLWRPLTLPSTPSLTGTMLNKRAPVITIAPSSRLPKTPNGYSPRPAETSLGLCLNFIPP